MKHLKLFENFENAPDLSNSLIFDWMPFDTQISNPIQSSIPEELSLDEMKKFVSEYKDKDKLKEAGLFIAHQKNSNGGFMRYITKSFSPLILEGEIFNSDFESVNKFPEIDVDKFNPTALKRGSSMLGKFGIYDDEEK
jgi:hypothetical protein